MDVQGCIWHKNRKLWSGITTLSSETPGLLSFPMEQRQKVGAVVIATVASVKTNAIWKVQFYRAGRATVVSPFGRPKKSDAIMIRFISRPNYLTNAGHSELAMNHFSIHPMETTLQHIIRRTGKKPISCKCKQCQQQCRTCPCLGTPSDIERLIDAGYSEQLAEMDWCVGQLVGAIPYPIPMVQAIQTDTGCIFFHDGLCVLHDKGLKPTEGDYPIIPHSPKNSGSAIRLRGTSQRNGSAKETPKQYGA